MIVIHKKKGEMDSNRKTAIIVGVLFIVATVGSSLYYVILDPILTAPDYLIKISENANHVIIGILLYLIDNAAVVAIPILLFPILKKYNEALALGYVGSRIIESVTVIVGHISLLSLMTLSQEYVKVAATDASCFQALGALLLSVIDWSHLVSVEIVFAVTPLILNYLLYKSKLIPRFISVWGLIGAIFLLMGGFLGMFGLGTNSEISIFSLLIFVQEMVFAIWLIVKGVDASAIASDSA